MKSRGEDSILMDKQSEFLLFPTITFLFCYNIFYKTKTVATCSHGLPFINLFLWVFSFYLIQWDAVGVALSISYMTFSDT